MNTEQLCFGQRYDSELGILEPWYTNPAMDEIKTWDLSDKVVLEFGGGASSIWWGTKSARCYTIEANAKWYNDIVGMRDANRLINLAVYLREINEGDQTRVEEYLDFPDDCKPDIIIADGILRTEVVEKAIRYFKENGGGILIADNFWQDYVWLSPKAVELVEPFKKQLYPQLDHLDHSGNCWKTLISYIK